MGDDTFEHDDDEAGQAGRGDQLEEPATCVGTVGEPGSHERVLTAEQVRDLQPDEQADDDIDDHEHDQRLGNPECRGQGHRRSSGGGPQRTRGFTWLDPRVLHADCCRGQHARHEPGHRQGEQDSRHQVIEVDLPAKHVFQSLPEDRISR